MKKGPHFKPMDENCIKGKNVAENNFILNSRKRIIAYLSEKDCMGDTK